MDLKMKVKFLNFCEKLEMKKYLKQPSFVEFIGSNLFFLEGNLCEKYFEFKCYKLYNISKWLKINIERGEIQDYLRNKNGVKKIK